MLSEKKMVSFGLVWTLVPILTTRVAGGTTLIVSSVAFDWDIRLYTLIFNLDLPIDEILTLVTTLTTRVAGGTTLIISSQAVCQDNC